jgi:dTMP kinase
MKRGRFITFEGIDGAGKSTHLAWAERFLRARKLDLVVTREPGGTPLGESLRALLLGSATPVGPETEALLMFAARSQHLQEVILPALERGAWVLCDRFTDATFAYQGGGSGVPSRKLALLEAWVHPRLKPDLTVLFDVSAEVGRQRVARIKSPDRFEREGAAFFKRVRAAYLRRMRDNPRRIVRIDGGKAMPDIQVDLEKLFLKLWKKK